MAFIIKKNGIANPSDGIEINWSDITSIEVRQHHDDSYANGIAVNAFCASGSGCSVGIMSSEKSFKSIVRALGRELPGLGDKWYQDALGEFANYRIWGAELWWREPSSSEAHLVENEVLDDESLWTWFEEVGAKIGRKRKPTKKDVAFLRIYELMNQIGNGGLLGYFAEPYGEHAVAATKALRLIGAVESAKGMERAIKLFPNGKISRSQRVRERQLDQMTDARLDQLDSKWEDAIWSRADNDWLQLLHDWYCD